MTTIVEHSADTADPLRPRTALYIDGHWRSSIDGETITVDNPTTGEPLTTIVLAGQADALAAVSAAQVALSTGPWSRLTPTERGAKLLAFADAMERRTEEFLDVAVADFGVPRIFAGYAHQCAVMLFRDYAAMADSLVLSEVRSGPGFRTVIRREPSGVVLAIVPFNAPTALFAVKVAPALLAGCSVIVKASPETALASYLLAEVAAEVGLPAGVLNILPAERQVGEALVAHPAVNHVSFTGSTASGIRVMQSAATHMARVTLELGGKSAAVLLDDADPAAVLPLLAGLSLGQSGQVCTAYTRILVSEAMHDTWAALLSQTFNSLPMGDPATDGIIIGPLVSADAVDRADRYVREAVEAGATVLTGGVRPDGKGYYYPPTLLDGVSPDAKVAREEVFGPVISLITYRDVDDAVAIANGTPFGLAAGVFGSDQRTLDDLAARLEAGVVSVNSTGTAMNQPFGGYGMSGVGREGGREGLEEFFEIKQVSLPA